MWKYHSVLLHQYFMFCLLCYMLYIKQIHIAFVYCNIFLLYELHILYIKDGHVCFCFPWMPCVGTRNTHTFFHVYSHLVFDKNPVSLTVSDSWHLWDPKRGRCNIFCSSLQKLHPFKILFISNTHNIFLSHGVSSWYNKFKFVVWAVNVPKKHQG